MVTIIVNDFYLYCYFKVVCLTLFDLTFLSITLKCIECYVYKTKIPFILKGAFYFESLQRGCPIFCSRSLWCKFSSKLIWGEIPRQIFMKPLLRTCVLYRFWVIVKFCSVPHNFSKSGSLSDGNTKAPMTAPSVRLTVSHPMKGHETASDMKH